MPGEGRSRGGDGEKGGANKRANAETAHDFNFLEQGLRRLFGNNVTEI
jgi:hypothetical protein